MANYTPAATRIAKQFGLPVPLFLTLVKWESGWQPSVVSSKGAIGLTQLMPGTAKSLGVDPWNPVENLTGGARYLKQQYDTFGSWRLALAAYYGGPGSIKNGRVPSFSLNYVNGILSATPAKIPDSPAVSPETPADPGETAAPPAPPPLPDFTQTALSSLNRAAHGQYDASRSLSELTSSVLEQATAPSAAPVSQPTGSTPTTVTPPNKPPSSSDWTKWVSVAPGADRDGTPTVPGVVRFVAKVGRLAGEPLTITTGSDHRQYVQGTRRQSQHWTGHAADIAMTGDELTRVGRLALIAAGMPRKKAMKVTGGAFTIGRYNILFNTMIGGDHFTHLHIGVR